MKHLNTEVLELEKVRDLVESVVRKIPLQEGLFKEEYRYLVFFPLSNVRRGDRLMVYSLKRVVWFACVSFFGKRMDDRDLDLVLRSGLGMHRFSFLRHEFSKCRRTRYAELYRYLMSQMEQDDEIRSFAWEEAASAAGDKGSGSADDLFLSGEQSDFMEKVFQAIKIETGISGEVIKSDSRDRNCAVLRCVALLVFLKRYPDSSETLLGLAVGRSRGGANGILKRISEYYFEAKFKKFDDVAEFLGLIERIPLQIKDL